MTCLNKASVKKKLTAKRNGDQNTSSNHCLWFIVGHLFTLQSPNCDFSRILFFPHEFATQILYKFISYEMTSSTCLRYDIMYMSEMRAMMLQKWVRTTRHDEQLELTVRYDYNKSWGSCLLMFAETNSHYLFHICKIMTTKWACHFSCSTKSETREKISFISN